MKKPLKKEKYKFNIKDAKPYIIGILICFHIVPLIFVIMGDTGAEILQNTMMLLLNPILIFLIGLLYGVRFGYEWKFPLLAGFLSTLSILMYYSFLNVMYMVQSVVLCAVVYFLFVYMSVLGGSFLKRFLV